MLQNLLSSSRKKEFKLEYYTRLITVCALLLSFAVIIGFVALVPGYVNVRSELSIKNTEYAQKQKETESDKGLLNETLQSAYILDALEKDLQKEKLTVLLDEILEKRPEGITIVGFSYNRIGKKISLQGIAETRDIVAPFARVLEESDCFTTVPVPISALAKKTNLDFTLDIGLAEYSEKTR